MINSTRSVVSVAALALILTGCSGKSANGSGTSPIGFKPAASSKNSGSNSFASKQTLFKSVNGNYDYVVLVHISTNGSTISRLTDATLENGVSTDIVNSVSFAPLTDTLVDSLIETFDTMVDGPKLKADKAETYLLSINVPVIKYGMNVFKFQLELSNSGVVSVTDNIKLDSAVYK